MAQDLEQIAQGMREATKGHQSVRVWLDFLEPLWADEVTVHHHPAIDGVDGVRPRAEFIALERRGMEFGLTQTPDLYEEIGGIRIQDDKITFTAARGWTAPDGTPVHQTSVLMEFAFRDGRIYRYDVWYDKAVTETPEYNEAMRALGVSGS